MFAGLSVVEVFMLACLGVMLDAVFGEPRRAHPLVAFGRVAAWLERALNSDDRSGAVGRRTLGALVLAVLVGVPVLATALAIAYAPLWAAWCIHAAALYFALGAKSLQQHVRVVVDALGASDLPLARALGARIVSRDLGDAEAPDVARAAVESTLENGNDAIFGALFWFVILGAPGAIAYRLINTLDAMWGYKTARYVFFGWAAARLDDAINYVPARLTALTYALLGDTRAGFACWRMQGGLWESPNAGPVMAAGAGALNVALGGAAQYHGQVEQRPQLGSGATPGAADIDRALTLVSSGVALWLAVLALVAVGAWWSAYA
jgi:adenosylcobinamide-phosphate synthase